MCAQCPDVWMHLNQGFFRQNGGCGYVLKPEVMRGSSQSMVYCGAMFVLLTSEYGLQVQ